MTSTLNCSSLGTVLCSTGATAVILAGRYAPRLAQPPAPSWKSSHVRSICLPPDPQPAIKTPFSSAETGLNSNILHKYRSKNQIFTFPGHVAMINSCFQIESDVEARSRVRRRDKSLFTVKSPALAR